jgi:hypothetical protein
MHRHVDDDVHHDEHSVVSFNTNLDAGLHDTVQHAFRPTYTDAFNFAVARSASGNASASNFWLKPTGQHPWATGGTVYTVGAPLRNAIVNWINGGLAPNDAVAGCALETRITTA